jgi:hypothetical protein
MVMLISDSSKKIQGNVFSTAIENTQKNFKKEN